MTEKSQQEITAAERQTDLLIAALDKAKENGGIWLNESGKKAPAFYQKEVYVSPFNSIMLGLHSDLNGHQTNLFTLFNIEQTTLPMVDKEAFDLAVKEQAAQVPSGRIEEAQNKVRSTVEKIFRGDTPQDRFSAELAIGAKLQEMGMPAKLSDESLGMIEDWKQALKDNPNLLDKVERDVNNAVRLMVPFRSQASDEELAKIEHVTIFKTKATEGNPSKILCMPTIGGEKQKPREVSQLQWQKMWLAEDMQEFKKHLAATLFADKLKAIPSPMVQQFLDMKRKHPEALLLFRTSDFYQSYSEDAEKVSKILGITLTKSEKMLDGDGKQMSMAGFPYHNLSDYLPKLVRAGQRVAICDQCELPEEIQATDKAQEQNQSEAEKSFTRGLHH